MNSQHSLSPGAQFCHVQTAEEAQPFLEMTFPAYRPRLREFDPKETQAIGVTWNGQVAGLIVARLNEKPLAYVLSIYVKPEWRRQGLAEGLLRELERGLRTAGFAMLEISYRSGTATAEVLEAWMERTGWPAPRVRQIYCRTNGRKMPQADWIQGMKLPKEYEVIRWTEVTEEDRESLRTRQAATPFFPEELNPLKHEAGFEPINSLGLRYRGEIVGWMITHRAGEDCIRYTCSYLRPDLQTAARLVALYSEAMNRQIAVLGKDSVGIWTVPVTLPRMAAFVRRRFAPFLLDLAEFRLSRRELLPE